MNRKRYIVWLLCWCVSLSIFAQGNREKAPVQWNRVTNETIEDIDYTRLVLPSLDTLFTSARFNNPQILKAMKTKEFQDQLIKKERRYWLSFFSGNANFTYGVNDNYITNSSVYMPAYQIYSGGTQSYWGIGGRVNLPLEDLFDLKGRVKRQKTQSDIAMQEAENTFNEIKERIITLYVEITNNLANLDYTAEIAADYQGQGMVMRERFLINQADITELAGARLHEVGIRQNYQNLLQSVATDCLILEVITGYPIISKSDIPMLGDGTDWSNLDLNKWLPIWFKERDIAKLRQYYRSRFLRFVDNTDNREYVCKCTTIRFTRSDDYYKLVFRAEDDTEQSVTLNVQELLTLSLNPSEWIYYNKFKFSSEAPDNRGTLWIQDSAKRITTTNK
jgi:hypothetical protein